jgi:ADP-heptose:LPS heptosyltransferase/GT2 family glycosyltransferase
MQARFRPGEDLGILATTAAAISAPEPLETDHRPGETFGFTAAAEARGSDLDVLMGYQIFLGRDPENSFVITDARGGPVSAFINAVLKSVEFQNLVLDRLALGAPLPQEATSLYPSPEQIGWVLRFLRLPARTRAGLREAADWRSWMQILADTPGFPAPLSRAAAAKAATPPPAAGKTPPPPAAGETAPPAAAGETFVLITIEQPKAADRLLPGGRITGGGWAIAPAEVTEIAVTLDGAPLGLARIGLPRPDVAGRFPHYRHADRCGFAFTAEVPPNAAIDGGAELAVTVTTASGQVGRKTIRLQPRSGQVRPAGGTGIVRLPPSVPEDVWPIRLSVHAAAIEPGRVLRLNGWALARRTLRRVTIAIAAGQGDALEAETRLGEAIHGQPTPDLASSHSAYRNPANAGFSITCRLPAAIPDGAALVRVQAADEQGQMRQTMVAVQIPPAEADTVCLAEPGSDANGGIRCVCDTVHLTSAGRLTVDGWAIAPAGIASLEVEFDGIAIGAATCGLPRPDIGKRFADHPAADTAGFEFAHSLPRRPGAGEHLVTLRIEDGSGTLRLLEMPVSEEVRPAIVRPAAPQVPDIRLEIDQPALDPIGVADKVRGAVTISGWAVARDGIESVSVYGEDRLLGQAHVGMRREDIGAAFPDHEGALLAGYALVLPWGALPPGRHPIRVVASSRGGDTLERGFILSIEPDDQPPPGADIRRTMPPAEAEFWQRQLRRLDCRPRFEVLVALDQAGDRALLQPTLDSLQAQIYADWTVIVGLPDADLADWWRRQPANAELAGRLQLCVAGAASPAAPARAASRRGSRRVRAADRPERSPAADPAGGKPPGRHVLRLRAGDVLGCDALLQFAMAVAETGAPFLYADDLRHDAAEGRRQPFHKPAWSPELLLGLNYIGRCWCAEDGLLREAGLTHAELAAMSDYDAVLRLTERATSIAPIDRVLLACGPASDTPEAEQAALASAAARRAIDATIEPGRAARTWRLRRALAASPKGAAGRPDACLVSVIMPTCGAAGLVRTAVTSIRANMPPAGDGVGVEIVILDNTPPEDGETRAWLRRHADRVIDMPGPFNWSRFNNQGARAANGDYLLFLNDDIEIRDPGWLSALLEHAQRPGVGVVGARLLYPDGKVQHAGQYLTETQSRHAFRFADAGSTGPFGIATVAREMMSVTGACQLIPRPVFESLGGYEEAHSVVNNDVDFCLRAWRAGLAVLYTPHATLIHHELVSRARLQDSYDGEIFASTWRRRFLAGDPFRSPRLMPEADQEDADPEPPVLLHAGRRGPLPATVRRILAVKLDHIGDFLTALPALRSLQRRFPNAAIDLLAPAATGELARQAPEIRDIVAFEFFHARSGEGRRGLNQAALEALRARLAPARYDIAIDLRMHPETREVLPYTGAGLLAGFDRLNQFPWLDVALEWEGDERLVAKRAHISERLIQLVAATEEACLPPLAAAPLVPLSPQDVPALAGLPAAFIGRPIVCVHPGVGNVVRQWPASSYAGLIDLLAAEGLHTVLIGGPEESPVAEAVLREVTAAGAARSLVGQVGLAQLPDLMRACVLFVGNNSGPQHIAASVGLPTVGIHSGVVDAREWAPLGEQALAIRRQMVCGPCYVEFASDCPRGLACLTGLRPREVFEVCRRLLTVRASG